MGEPVLRRISFGEHVASEQHSEVKHPRLDGEMLAMAGGSLEHSLLVEVLSPSAESWERGEKRRRYRQLPSLQEHLLVSQGQPPLEPYRRQNDGRWLDEARGHDETLRLSALGVTLSVDDVYTVLAGLSRESAP